VQATGVSAPFLRTTNLQDRPVPGDELIHTRKFDSVPETVISC
jgi:hypothetical protein